MSTKTRRSEAPTFIIRGSLNHYAAYMQSADGSEAECASGWDYSFRLGMMLYDRYPNCKILVAPESSETFPPKL